MARAMPKSITFTAPAEVIMMLAGLISRCTMPRLWLNSSAVHTSAMMEIARCGGIAPWRAISLPTVAPSTYSITRNGSLPCGVCASPVSYTATIDGWFSAAVCLASRRKRW